MVRWLTAVTVVFVLAWIPASVFAQDPPAQRELPAASESETESEEEGEVDALGALLDDEQTPDETERDDPRGDEDPSEGEAPSDDPVRATPQDETTTPAESPESARVSAAVRQAFDDDLTASDEDDLNNVLNGPGVGATNKAWQVILATTTAVSSGAFVTLEADSTPIFNSTAPGSADRGGSLSQNFDARFQYNFKLFGEALRARARWLFNAEYTQPNSTANERFQRFQPSDIAIDLTDMSILSDETFGILLGGFRFTLPTSRGSDFVDLKTELSAFGTWVKPFSNGLLLFTGARVGWRIQDGVAGTCRFVESNPVSQTNPDALDGGECDFGQVPVQEGNPSDNLVTSLSIGAQYAATDEFTLSYSLAMVWTFGGISASELSSPNADTGFDIQTSNYFYGLSANYLLNDALAGLFGEMPFSLSGGLSVSVLHAMTTADNSPFLPLWYQAFSENRGAENTAQFGLDLVASY